MESEAPSAEPDPLALSATLDRLASTIRARGASTPQGLRDVASDLRTLVERAPGDDDSELRAVCERGLRLVDGALSRGPGGERAYERLQAWLVELVEYARAVARHVGEPDGGPRVPPPDVNEFSDFLSDFVVEARKLLDEASRALDDLDRGTNELAAVNAMLRALHSLRGMAGHLALVWVVRVTRDVEALLARVRSGEDEADPDVRAALRGGLAVLTELCETAAGGPRPRIARVERACERMRGEGARAPAEAASSEASSPAETSDSPSDPDVVRLGELLLRSRRITPRALEVALADQRETGKRLGETLVELGLASRADVEEALRLQSLERAGVRADRLPLGELLVRLSLITPRALDVALAEQRVTGRRLGETLVDLGLVNAAQIDRALELQSSGVERLERELGVAPENILRDLLARGAMEAPSVAAPRERGAAHAEREPFARVAVRRLDGLLDHLSELAGEHRSIARHGLLARPEGEALATAIEALGRGLGRLREEVLGLRLAPVGDCLARLEATLQDAEEKSGKRVRLVVDDGGLELDRDLLEEVEDALRHMVRNAIDHGIESTTRRAERGKDPVGEVRIAARLEGGDAVIEVADDGGGMEPERLVEQARSRGFLPPECGEREAPDPLQLVFLPGFSTRDEIGDLSGLGVGMDVVRRRAEGRHGTVEAETRYGEGTRFALRIPVASAATQVALLRSGERVLALPADALDTDAGLDPASICRFPDGRELCRWDGEYVPLVRLRDGDERPARLVALRSSAGRVAVAVEELALPSRREVRGGLVHEGLATVTLDDGTEAPLSSADELLD